MSKSRGRVPRTNGDESKGAVSDADDDVPLHVLSGTPTPTPAPAPAPAVAPAVAAAAVPSDPRPKAAASVAAPSPAPALSSESKRAPGPVPVVSVVPEREAGRKRARSPMKIVLDRTALPKGSTVVESETEILPNVCMIATTGWPYKHKYYAAVNQQLNAPGAWVDGEARLDIGRLVADICHATQHTEEKVVSNLLNLPSALAVADLDVVSGGPTTLIVRRGRPALDIKLV